MVSIKRIASGEEAGIPLEKKMETGQEGAEKEIRARSVSANLCSARMEIYGPLIGGVGSASR